MQVGKEVVFEDPDGGTSIKVYVRKLTPIDQQAAVKHANAARVKAKLRYKDEDGEEFLSVLGDVEEMGKEGCVEYLVAAGAGEKVERIEAQVSDEDEWKKDSHLESLRDAWAQGLENTFKSLEEDDPEREEANAVFAELKRFTSQVEELLSDELDNHRDVLMARDDDWIFHEAAVKTLESESEQVWLGAFHEAQIYYGVRRHDKHNTRYFESFDEVRNLSQDILSRLLTEYAELNVPVTEGKDSGEAPSS